MIHNLDIDIKQNNVQPENRTKTEKQNQRLKQKNLTRQLLLESAMRLFSENGFSNTTTYAISKAAGVSHGTVFAHFKTQEELLIAILEDFGKRVNSRLHALAGRGDSLRDVLEAHIEGLQEFEDFYIRLVTENRLLPQEARNVFLLLQSTISFHLSQAMEKEVSEGRIKNLPVHLVFNGWVGLLHHYITNNDLFCPEGSVLKRHSKEILDYYLSLLSANSQ